MKKSEYKKIGSAWDIDTDDISRSKIDDFYTESSECSNGYRKSTQKKKKKSDHKHDYKEVLLRVTYSNPFTGKLNQRLHLGKKCSVCGLIKETKWFITESTGDGYSRELTYDEIIKKYPDYEIVDYC